MQALFSIPGTNRVLVIVETQCKSSLRVNKKPLGWFAIVCLGSCHLFAVDCFYLSFRKPCVKCAPTRVLRQTSCTNKKSLEALIHLNLTHVRRVAQSSERYRPPPTSPSIFPRETFVHSHVHIADLVERLKQMRIGSDRCKWQRRYLVIWISFSIADFHAWLGMEGV